MASIKEISKFLDERIDPDSIQDTSNNGLQVSTDSDIKKIAFAVDACKQVFAIAAERNADMIIVHHGLSWADSLKRLTGMNYDRIKVLIKNDIALYATHLPLDKHDEYGNNILLANMLELDDIEPFGTYHAFTIGYRGKFSKALTILEIKDIIDDKINSDSQVYQLGPEKITTIGIVSGGGGSAIADAIELGIDCLLIGEGSHHLYHEAKEHGINLIFAGHYHTETLGVKALMPLLKEKFGVEVEFIDVPTPF